MTKATQQERILAYLRKHKVATNRDLMLACDVMCPWKRIFEMQNAWWWRANNDGNAFATVYVERGAVSDKERITRHFIKTKGGARVVQYRLERA